MKSHQPPFLTLPVVPATSARMAGLLAVVALILSGCGGTVATPKKSIAHKPVSSAPAPGRYRAGSTEFRQCAVKLASLNAQYTPLPDRSYNGGCTAYGSVKLLDVGVPVSNLGAMTCSLAENFTAWARYGVAPAARLILGSELVKIETMGTFNCRPIAGTGRLSEHGHSNAVDISAFILADGRRITVKNHWNSDRRTKEFLRTVHASACKRFRTVLGPDYNEAHHDHLHFDMGGKGTYCR
ncbi:MAG: extensin family protein [Sphingobium sp.]|nr:extensin family protein [Sphingobium sp.]